MKIVEKIILLVDDDDDDKFIFKESLEKVCPEVKCITAENGRDCLDKISKQEIIPLFIFLDINMPIMNGFECLKELKKDKNYATIPVIIYSTSDDIKTQELAEQLGASRFLPKPASHKELEKYLKLIFSELEV
jgi:CheY-like chemotaxis protein